MSAAFFLAAYLTHNSIGGTFQAIARFQDSDISQKAIKMALRCNLSVNSHLSGFKLYSDPIQVNLSEHFSRESKLGVCFFDRVAFLYLFL